MEAGQSIRPTIFDVYADPSIAMPIILANLMSPRLWELSTRVGTELRLEERLQAYQGLLDRYFRHLAPAEVAEMDGTVRLSDEADRLGQDVIDRAVDGIVRTVRWRTARGTLTVGDPLMALLDQGLFPNYVYGTLDELHAHRELLGRARHRPMGITSCLDEAALFASLVSTGSVDDIDGAVLFGSAAHYTVLVWSGDPAGSEFRAWWFYGKNRLISHDEYSAIVRDDYRGDAQLAFDDRLPDADLLVSRRGSWAWKTGESSWPQEERDVVTAVLDRYFCGRIAGLDAALSRNVMPALDRGFDELFECTLGASGPEQVRDIIRGIDSPQATEALMCFRDTESIALDSFLPAALRGQRITRARVENDTIDAVLANVVSTEPVLPGGFRVAMPEELLAYGRGSDLDRELLRQAWRQP